MKPFIKSMMIQESAMNERVPEQKIIKFYPT